MLLWSFLHRNAHPSRFSPSREARELWLANGHGTGAPATQPENEEEPQEGTGAQGEHAPSPETEPGEVLEKGEKVLGDIETIHSLRKKIEKSVETASPDLQKEAKPEWEDIKNFLAFVDKMKNVGEWVEALRGISNWSKRNIHPLALIDSLTHLKEQWEQTQPQTPERANVLATLQQCITTIQAYIAATGNKPNEEERVTEEAIVNTPWGTRSQDAKERIRQEVNALSFTINGETQTVSDVIRTITESLDNELGTLQAGIEEHAILERLQKFEQALGISSKKMTEGGVEGTIHDTQQGLSGLKIEWYTLAEVWGGFQKLWEAWTHSRERKKKLKSTKFAASLSGLLPHDVRTALELAREKELHEEAEAEKPKFEKLPFASLVEQLAHHHDDPLSCQAILEIAAEKGWLYGSDEEQTKPAMERKLLGYPIGRIASLYGWHEEETQGFFSKLYAKYTSASRTAAEEAKEMTPLYADDIVNMIRKEIGKGNFWKVRGVAERAILGKVKLGEISPLITVTILRALKDNPHTARWCPPKFFDEVGGIGVGRVPFTIMGFKAGEASKPLARWVQGEIKFEEAATITKTITDIERDIERTGITLSTNEKDRIVAQVLAGQTIKEIKGKPVFISIFSKAYEGYRKSVGSKEERYSANLRTDPPIDPDFMNKESDILLLSASPTADVLATTNADKFQQDRLAIGYLSLVLKRYDELHNLARQGVEGAEETFQAFASEARRKLTSAFTFELQKARFINYALTLKINPGLGNPNIALFPALIRRELIESSVLDAAAAHAAPAIAELRKRARSSR